MGVKSGRTRLKILSRWVRRHGAAFPNRHVAGSFARCCPYQLRATRHCRYSSHRQSHETLTRCSIWPLPARTQLPFRALGLRARNDRTTPRELRSPQPSHPPAQAGVWPRQRAERCRTDTARRSSMWPLDWFRPAAAAHAQGASCWTVIRRLAGRAIPSRLRMKRPDSFSPWLDPPARSW